MCLFQKDNARVAQRTTITRPQSQQRIDSKFSITSARTDLYEQHEIDRNHKLRLPNKVYKMSSAKNDMKVGNARNNKSKKRDLLDESDNSFHNMHDIIEAFNPNVKVNYCLYSN